MGSSVILPPRGQPKTGPDTTFKSAAIPNLVTFGLDRIEPPSPLYIQRDDLLVVTAVTALGLLDTVTVNLRLLLAPSVRGGQPDAPGAPDPSQSAQSSNIIVPSAAVLPMAAIFTPVTQILPLAEGYLLSVGATCATATQRGNTYVRVQIQRGKTATVNGPVFRTLFADYVTRSNSVGWPEGRVLEPAESTGALFNQTNAAPAAGVDWTFAWQSLSRTQLLSFSALLTTSAVVANRIVRIQLLDIAANIVYQGAANALIPASTAAQVSGLEGQNTSTIDATTVNVALPGPMIWSGGYTLRVNTLNLQAGDQWGQQNFQVQQWLANV